MRVFFKDDSVYTDWLKVILVIHQDNVLFSVLYCCNFNTTGLEKSL